MVKVNMHDAKSRLSELVRAVEKDNQVVLLCRNGVAVAELTAIKGKARANRLKGDSRLKIELAPGFDPAEPATEQDWPSASR